MVSVEILYGLMEMEPTLLVDKADRSAAVNVALPAFPANDFKATLSFELVINTITESAAYKAEPNGMLIPEALLTETGKLL